MLPSLYTPQIKPPMWAGPEVMAANVQHWHDKKGLPRPIFFMPFWEGGGSRVYDLSGNNNHGTLGGAVGPIWIGDKLFYNSNVDRNGYYITLDTQIVWNTTDLWTLHVRCLSLEQNDYRAIFGGGTNSRFFCNSGDHSDIFLYSDSGDAGNIDNTAFDINTEHDIFLTRNSQDEFYVTIDNIPGGTISDALFDEVRIDYIGANQTPDYGWDGYIWFFNLYPDILSSAQMEVLRYQAYGAIYPVDQVSYFDFTEVATDLVVADTAHTQSADAIALTVPLELNDSAHLQVPDNIDLGNITVSTNETYHVQASENSAFVVPLTAQETYHDQIADSYDLTTTISVSETHHVQASDAVSITEFIVPQDSTHLQAADKVYFVSDLELVPEGYYPAAISQAQLADNTALFVYLAVDGSAHIQAADNIVHTIDLVVSESHHVQEVEAASAGHLVISLSSAAHVQTADNIFLNLLLEVNGCDHLQVIGAVVIVPALVADETHHLQTVGSHGLLDQEHNLGIIQNGPWHDQYADNVVLAFRPSLSADIIETTFTDIGTHRTIISLDEEARNAA